MTLPIKCLHCGATVDMAKDVGTGSAVCSNCSRPLDQESAPPGGGVVDPPKAIGKGRRMWRLFAVVGVLLVVWIVAISALQFTEVGARSSRPKHRPAKRTRVHFRAQPGVGVFPFAAYDVKPGEETYADLIGPASFAISPDLRKLATCGGAIGGKGEERRLTLWDLVSGRRLDDIDDFGSQLSFSPDNNHFHVLRPDRELRVWDAATGNVVRHFKLGGMMYVPKGITYSSDGQILVLPDANRFKVMLYETGRTLAMRWEPNTIVRSGACSPAEMILVLGKEHSDRDDAWFDVYSLQTGEHLKRIPVEDSTCHDIAFSRDGKTLAATSHRGSLIAVYDTDDWSKRARLLRPGLAPLGKMEVSHRGSHVVVLSGTKIDVWDVESANVRELVPKNKTHCNDFVCLPGDIVAIASLANPLQFYDLVTGDLREAPRPVVGSSESEEDRIRKLPPERRAVAFRNLGMFQQALDEYEPLLLAASVSSSSPSHEIF